MGVLSLWRDNARDGGMAGPGARGDHADAGGAHSACVGLGHIAALPRGGVDQGKAVPATSCSASSTSR